MNRKLPFGLLDFYLAYFLVERADHAIDEQLGYCVRPRLPLAHPHHITLLDYVTVELVAVWRTDRQLLFQQRLPASWQKLFNEMNEHEKRVIIVTAYLQLLTAIVLTASHVVLGENEGATRRQLLLQKFELNKMVELNIADLDVLSAVDLVKSLLDHVVAASFLLFALFQVLPVVLGLQAKYVKRVLRHEDLRVWSGAHGFVCCSVRGKGLLLRCSLSRRLPAFSRGPRRACTFSLKVSKCWTVQIVGYDNFEQLVAVPPDVFLAFEIQLLQHLIKPRLSSLMAYFDDIWINRLRKLHGFDLFLFFLFLAAEPVRIEELEIAIVTFLVFFDVGVAVAGACVVIELAFGPSPLATQVLANHVFAEVRIKDIVIELHVTLRLLVLRVYAGILLHGAELWRVRVIREAPSLVVQSLTQLLPVSIVFHHLIHIA